MTATSDRSPGPLASDRPRVLQGVPWLQFGAGALGGAIGAVVTSPLEVIKTRLQSSVFSHTPARIGPNKSFLGLQVSTMTDCFRDTVRVEGVRALWKGLGANLVGVVPARAIYFASYSWVKPRLISTMGGETSVVHLFSAATAAFVTSSATNPIWLVKTRLQLERSVNQRSVAMVTMAIFRKEGIRGFYKGLSASYAGIFETAMYFVLYERLKKRALRDNESTALKSFKVLAAAATAKFFACTVWYPHEVLRTRLREAPSAHGVRKYTGLVQAARLVWREDGGRGFYRGLLPHIMRVVPNSAIIFLTFELVMQVAGPPADLAAASKKSLY